MANSSPLIFPDESSFKTLARALEPLELDGRLRYLPAFECCGSCANARIHGFMGSPGEDWGTAELYVTFNEQSADSASDGYKLMLATWLFDPKATDEEEAAAKDLVAEALIAGGFREVEPPAEEYSYRVAHDPNFRFNTFYRENGGHITVLGLFEGKAKPTKAVRQRIKDLKLNH